MRLLIAILVVAFVVGGATTESSLLRRPLTILGACVLAGALFYSQRAL